MCSRVKSENTWVLRAYILIHPALENYFEAANHKGALFPGAAEQIEQDDTSGSCV